MRRVRLLQLEGALMAVCAIIAQVAEQQGYVGPRDAYLSLAGCWGALAALTVSGL